MEQSIKVTRLDTHWPLPKQKAAQDLPTSKFLFIDNYSLNVISKVIVCLLDHYSMMKSDSFSLYPISIIK